jgi:hypothetical protein
LHLLHRAFREDLSLVHDRDLVRDAHEAMSCSITITERLRQMRSSSSAVSSRSRTLMPAIGSSSISSSAPASAACRSPATASGRARAAGFRVERVGEADLGGHVATPRTSVPLEGERAERCARAETTPRGSANTQVFVDRRRLELAATDARDRLARRVISRCGT